MKAKRAIRRTSGKAKAVATSTGGFSPSWSGANAGLYPVTPDSTQRGWRPDLNRDAATLISRYKHRAMLSDARYVYTGVGQVSGAIRDKANFVVGGAWVPQYHGKNPTYKAAFTEIMKRWMRNCDLRGGPYDWQKNVRLSCVSLDRDGELFIVTTESEQKSPRLQFLESHRIGGDWNDKVPEKVPIYGGRKVCNGIIYDDAMRPLGYNLLPPDQLWLKNDEWNIIPARSVIHVFDPEWFSQNRGIPTICNGILDWYDIGEIRDAEKTGVKAASRVALLETNVTGKPDLTANAMRARAAGDPNQIDVNSKLIENGLIHYIKAGSGSNLEAFTSSRPGSAWVGFVEHISRSAHRGMDWPVEMNDWSKVGGAAVRAVTGQVIRSVSSRQDALWYPMLSAVLYAASYYIKRGDLPFVDDWMNVEFTKPPQFSVDIGRDSQNRRQDVAMGIRGLDDIFGEEGEGDVESVFNRRAEIWNLREAVAKKHGVPVEAIYNPGAASVQAAATAGEGTVWQQQDQEAQPPDSKPADQ